MQMMIDILAWLSAVTMLVVIWVYVEEIRADWKYVDIAKIVVLIWLIVMLMFPVLFIVTY